MAAIFSLFGEVFVDNEKATKNIKDIKQAGEDTGKSFAEKFGSIAKTSIKVGTAVAGAATAAIGGLTAMANSTADVADEIDKGSIRMGISTKSYQELKYAAGQCGVEITNLEKAAKKLEGTDLNMDDAMKSIMKLSTAEERAKKATELFGSSVAYTLSPLISQSKEEFDGLITRANDLGLVMSEDAVAAGVTFGDTMSDVQQSLAAAGNKLTSSFMPVIQKVLDLIIEHMPQIQAMIDRLAPVIINLLDKILPVFIDFAEMLLPIIFDLLEQLIESILPIFADLLQIILPPLIQIIQELLPILLPIIEALLPLLTPIFDLLKFVTDTVLKPIISVITSIINVISNHLTKTLKALTPVVNGVKDVFQKVFGSLFNVVKIPINAIIDGINLFIKALNKIKIPDWVPAVGGKGIDIPLIKKLRIGIDYVPYDNMPAILHKGESVLTASENKEYQKQKSHQKEESSNVVYNNNITIEKLEVRDEQDIEQIARELYFLQKKEVGA